MWQRLWFAKLMLREAVQTLSFRGRRSRNKVSVGEPAEGSLSFLHPHTAYLTVFTGGVARRVLVACDVFRTLLRQTFGVRRDRFGVSFAPPLEPVARRITKYTTLVDGYLGMSNDEERSEMRYVVRIAEFSESSNL